MCSLSCTCTFRLAQIITRTKKEDQIQNFWNNFSKNMIQNDLLCQFFISLKADKGNDKTLFIYDNFCFYRWPKVNQWRTGESLILTCLCKCVLKYILKIGCNSFNFSSSIRLWRLEAMCRDMLRIMPLRGSILQGGICKILSLALNPRWSLVW